jgi:hypothetical protein
MMRTAALLVFLTQGAGAADQSGELLAQIRRHMTDNLARLPNYTCRETIERVRGQQGSKHFNLLDRLRLEVAYVSGRELYAWPGATRFDDRSIEELVGGGGAISSGGFAGHAQAVFTTDAPQFTWGGEEQRNGRRIARFDFQVPASKSRYAIQTGENPVVVAYTGFFEADAETLDALLLEVRGTDLPAELKLRDSGQTMQYQHMRIGDSDFLLPVSSELWMVEVNGREDRNLTRFQACKQYSGESTVSFDVDETGSRVERAAVPIEVPTQLLLEAVLREPVDQAIAARGDVVHAVVSSDLKKSGQVIVPKGAVLTGRISRIETVMRRSLVYFGVGIHFRTIEFGGRHGDLAADVEMAGVGPDYSIGKDPATGDSIIFVKSKVERLAAGTRLALRIK